MPSVRIDGLAEALPGLIGIFADFFGFAITFVLVMLYYTAYAASFAEAMPSQPPCSPKQRAIRAICSGGSTALYTTIQCVMRFPTSMSLLGLAVGLFFMCGFAGFVGVFFVCGISEQRTVKTNDGLPLKQLPTPKKALLF